MDRPSIIFCVVTLAVSLGLAWLFFPLASLPKGTLQAAQKPQPAEAMGAVDLGDGFGSVAVSELMNYYIDNPPQPASPGTPAAPVVHFGGC
ncbi:hypothetical protein [Varunaivibrio sulfuroxidans]|uniref:Uncharacterized protein n=1 Tax=Varunaivibrio sulfuroxidans TaxID=1773489 RepID=A0A4R3J6V6_9PROT|nr:hypothetical protein [Varunaivibrio sulfuroxidans]TCS60603.1 hypothetical protein EDD55_11078 [Varunaivibrio sulfuroxidans]WES30093.1 hypothetical protein P3M64_10655 [Varunaivibrio sulfuroxidans]